MILKRSRTPQLDVWTRRYDNLSGALPRDNSDLEVVPRTVEVKITITALILACMGQVEVHWHLPKIKCQQSGFLITPKIIGRSYGGLKLMGFPTSVAKEKCLLGLNS